MIALFSSPLYYSSFCHLCCITEILHEAEELWQRQSGSDSSSEVGSISSGTLSDGGCLTAQEMTLPSPRYVHTPTSSGRHNNLAMLPPSAIAAAHGDFQHIYYNTNTIILFSKCFRIITHVQSFIINALSLF